MLDPGRGRTKTGQLWAYARDDRPWGGTDPPGVAYVYAPDRKAERPIAHLAGFSGILQVDGYAGYRGPGRARRRRARLLLVPCAPALLRTRHGRPRADRQRGARTHRRALRHREPRSAAAAPTSAAPSARRRAGRSSTTFEPWLRAKLGLISQKTKLAEAIRYALSRWEGLTRFLDDGRIEIDTNVVERSIRPIALNRKNALFAGSDGGGEHWAVIASLIETCKLNDVEPARLSRRRPHQDRQRPPEQPDRRTAALGLSRFPRTLAVA